MLAGKGVSVCLHSFCRLEWFITEMQKYWSGLFHSTWRFHCFPILCSRCCLFRVLLIQLSLAGLVNRKVVFVDVHDEELIELHVFMTLQRSALVWPAQSLQMDAQTLRELQQYSREKKSRSHFQWKETAVQVKSILKDLVSLVDKEVHHWTVPLCATRNVHSNLLEWIVRHG